MKVRPFLYGMLIAEFLVLGAGVVATRVLRPSCYSGSQAYLLAENAGAVIDVKKHADGTSGSAVVVFRPRKERGWASQHLLSRFDLSVELNENPVVVRNSGRTCRAPQ